ncbi:RagB/SusD family nutrient uptake outer membrane protein [Bacteroides graminisolvens]|uniref:RagB/SusD family nutrient uptake outer membrane protein n=1 Tax=Bacteroides graminisolvens TaxID=477666 RepID=UPI0023F21E58|nr:RagB/SusD family nutrient uptake outer membrane protein [Bacteroides graminisolvens]MDD3211748.1 RagB/SusD family nutrient uptake outer membrane protein [Bacteroides graminisolvens]MDD4417414.1 RagB/SusD family nutrient uptake outer membrane protein [Bacteroides graminisolvens]
MKKIKFILSICLAVFSLSACSDFLEEKAKGILTTEEVKDAYEDALIAAYSSLGNDHYDVPLSLWPYGTVRSDDAYKGGSGTQDIAVFHFFEVSNNITTEFGEVDRLWYQCYVSISRANSAINAISSAGDFEGKEAKIAEARFLRGHFYFLLKILFKYVPYVDETTPITDYGTVSNRALTNDALWQKIVDDFKYGVDHLPVKQPEVGRPDKYAAAAYLAKTYLYKAYRQDMENSNAVTSINSDDLNNVVTYADMVIASDYDLEEDFAYNFLPGKYENGIESIFAVQYSGEDGTKFGRVNFGDLLSVPMKLGCCDFLKPSQTLVNAFSTQDGLPVDNYNTNESGYAEKNDPRLFHTVALPGLPYKYNEELIYENDWNRSPDTYGYYASLKENVDPTCDCFVEMAPFYANTKNRIVIRYADVLLMKAEALIELHRAEEARTLINKVRNRAKNSTIFVFYALDKINISLYKAEGWNESSARKALRWERRLELAMENGRFFDLVRWGIAEEVMNEYYSDEQSRRNYYVGAHFSANKHEYLPIPEQQIKFSKYLYKQNVGY